MKIIKGNKISTFNIDNECWDYDKDEILNQYIDQLLNTDFDDMGPLIPFKRKNKYSKRKK